MEYTTLPLLIFAQLRSDVRIILMLIKRGENMKRLFRVVAVFAVTAMFVVTQLGQVSGQSNALAIQPRKDYNLNPGQSVQDTLTITNQNRDEPLNLNLNVVDFEARDETGSPLLLPTSRDRTAWSLKNFIDMPDRVTINPGETVRIPLVIEVPAGTGAGSYYSAIQYSAVSPSGDGPGNIANISASGASLIFVKVPGQAKQQLTFMQFGAFAPSAGGNDGSFKGLYFGERPRVMAYRLRNDGNIAEQPNASIQIKNFSGEVVYTVSDANPKDQLALRGQVRRFDACINPENKVQTTETGTDINSLVCGDTEKLSPGRYTAELTILYGENGNETREITARATFWYLPWWFVGLVVLGIAIVAGVVVWIVRKFKAYGSRKTRRR